IEAAATDSGLWLAIATGLLVATELLIATGLTIATATALTGVSSTAGAGVTGASASGAGDGLRRETVALLFAIYESLHFFEQCPHSAGGGIAMPLTGDAGATGERLLICDSIEQLAAEHGHAGLLEHAARLLAEGGARLLARDHDACLQRLADLARGAHQLQ